MGSTRYNMGNRGIRSGQWSSSKVTNLSRFNPAESEMHAVWSRNYARLHKTPGLTVIVQRTHTDFILPVTEADIRETLGLVKPDFLTGLAGVVALGGSKKQDRSFRRLFAYGCYCGNVIFLHPFPRRFMDQIWRTLPKPSLLHEYDRAGASITPNGRSWRIRFDTEALRRFYLRDVLMHELGHHVDRGNFAFKTDRKAERFADWFATEYGYKLQAGGGRRRGEPAPIVR